MTPSRRQIYQTFASLKLAVLVILSLATILAVATVVESLYGMRASHVMIYGQHWFSAVLFFLALNVFCAASIRYPWKKRQTGFVITHLGILTILLGSFITRQWGEDGILAVQEKAEDSQVIFDDLYLSIFDPEGNFLQKTRMPEFGRARTGKLLEINLGQNQKLTVEKFIPRSIAVREFKEVPLGVPAIQVEIFNSRFKIKEWLVNRTPDLATQVSLGPAHLSFEKFFDKNKESVFQSGGSYHPKVPPNFVAVQFEGKEYRISTDQKNTWQRAGDSPFSLRIQKILPYAVVEKGKLISRNSDWINPVVVFDLKSETGPVETHTVFSRFPEFSTLNKDHTHKGSSYPLKIYLVLPHADKSDPGQPRGRLEFAQTAGNQKLLYRIYKTQGIPTGRGTIEVGKTYPTGWMDLQFRVVKWYPSASEQWVPKEVDETSQDSGLQPAILLKSGQQESWLFEGTTKDFHVNGSSFFVQFTKEKKSLPFSIYLEKFTVANDPGTQKAASYQSDVMVKDPSQGLEKKASISMNEPLKYGGYTLYQASFQMADDRPPTSIFAVNKDPGRIVKYAGSLIMILGILVMFVMNPHYLGSLFGRKKNDDSEI